MRNISLILCLLITFFANAQRDPLQEKVTIKLNNISLEEALTIVSISYHVNFSYSDDLVPINSIVNLDIQSESLDAALRTLLAPFGIGYRKTSTGRIVLRKNPTALTQTIRGTVTELITGVPIPGATVVVNEMQPSYGSVTDDKGNFRIEKVPAGRVSLTVTSLGYDARVVPGILLATGKEEVIDVKLSESVVAMKEVVINALRNDGIPREGVAFTSSRTFSVEDTKRYAGSMGDPARMASAFAGVTGGADENNALIVRGNSPRGVLWRIEGIEVPNPNHFSTEGASHGVVSILSPNVIQNSDFLTGAFPAQYGNALSAVFDISLRNGNNQKREYAFQTGLLGVETSAEGPFSNRHSGSYLVNYRYSTLSILDQLNLGITQAGQYKDYQDLCFKLHFPTRAGTFSLFGVGGKSNSNRSDTTLFDNSASNVGTLGLTYRNMVCSHTVINSSLSFSGSQISDNSEMHNSQADLVAVHENYGKSYMRMTVSAKRKITSKMYAETGFTFSRLNYNFYLKNIDTGNPTYAVIVNFRERGMSNIAQAFFYTRQYLSQKVFAFYGFHYLGFSLSHDQSIEPRVGMRWQMNEQQSLSLAFGKHSRVENLQYYLARDHQSGGNEVQINKNLGFTRSNQIALSYVYRHASGHQVKAETYYQQLYNAPVQTDPASFYTALNEDTGFVTDTLTNNGNGKNYGIELSIEKPFSENYYYMINGALFESIFSVHGQPFRNTSYNGNHSFHGLAGREFKLNHDRGSIGINAKVTHAGGRRYIPIDAIKSQAEKRTVYNWKVAFEPRMPDYFRTDLQLVYRYNRARYSNEWRLDIQNVTNHRNAAYYYYEPATETVHLKKQIGIVPVISYKIQF